MELSTFERLLLWQQYEILKHVHPNEADDYKIIQDALMSGYKYVYSHVLPSMERELSDSRSKFVLDVLDMYDALSRVEEKTGKLLEGSFAHFCGFDGHGDLVGFAHFYVEKLHRYQSLNIKTFDAHMPIDRCYERMLAVWLPLGDVTRRFNLSEADAETIIASAEHQQSL